jgi:hypothetical protein
MNDPSNGNKRAILRSTFSVKESMPVLTESERGSLLSPPAVVAVALRGWPIPSLSQTGLPGQEELYAAHQGRWSRSPSSQLDRVDLLDGVAPARSHVTTFARGLALFLDQGGVNGLRRAVRIRDQECGNK